MREEVIPIDCTLEILDDGKEERTFIIQDRDGIDKTLVVDDNNWGEAYDSWQIVWEQQQAQKDQ